MKWVENGEVPILIGTHALIQKSVKFKHLAYAVIDEQHRFGVDQRKKLIKKAKYQPHLLSLSATPIPRSLALTLFRDLDLSKIKSAPNKDKVINTKILSRSEYARKIPEIKERKAGIQDEGSQVLAIAFAQAAQDQQPWLDLCAGPGGKASLLSFLSPVPLYANEISEARAELVSQVVREDSIISVGDGREIAVDVHSILADVPCTGLGALRRRPEVRWRRSAGDIPNLAKLQYELAAHAIDILPSGGIFAYATCSPHMAETRAQCATIEKKLPVEKIDVTPFLPENLENGVSNGYMQLWPHRHDTDAMFLALYRKR